MMVYNKTLYVIRLNTILDVKCISSVLSSLFSVKVSILHQTIYTQQMTFSSPIPTLQSTLQETTELQNVHTVSTQAADQRIHKTPNDSNDWLFVFLLLIGSLASIFIGGSLIYFRPILKRYTMY